MQSVCVDSEICLLDADVHHYPRHSRRGWAKTAWYAFDDAVRAWGERNTNRLNRIGEKWDELVDLIEYLNDYPGETKRIAKGYVRGVARWFGFHTSTDRVV